MNALGRFARGASALVAIAGYELGAHYAAVTSGAHGLGLAMALVPPLAFTLAAAARSPRRAWLLPLWVLVCAALWLARATLERHFGWGLYAEHAGFNLVMAFVFGRTLAAGRQPLCTHFATMIRGTLTPAIARYTRQITLAWTLFFAAIAAVSTLLFAAAPIGVWSTFANYLTLPLVAAMFAAELGCRRIVLRHEQRTGFVEALRAYRQSARRGRAFPGRAP